VIGKSDAEQLDLGKEKAGRKRSKKERPMDKLYISEKGTDLSKAGDR